MKTKEQGKPAGAAVPAPERASLLTVKRIYLMATAFLSGAAVMAVELAGTRILAPWFGNSLYTWTGLIGVILVCISCGYYLGGSLADRWPSGRVLAHILGVAAVATVVIPLVQGSLERSLGPMSVIAGPVVASLCLFAVPGILLGAVSPFAIRLTSLMSEDKHVGVSAGLIGMLSTLGSVVGTFATGFVLIPHMPLRSLFLVSGFILAVLAVLGYVLFLAGGGGHRALASVMLLGATAVGAWAVSDLGGGLPHNVLYEETSFYHRIRVYDREELDGRRSWILSLDSTTEGGQYQDGGKGMPLEYTKFWEVARVLAPNLERAVFLGGGAFTMPEAILDVYPKATVDVVEIDPRVVEVGRRYFRVDDYPRLYPKIVDARRFLKMNTEKYDMIFGDAYHGVHSIPAHLVTREFFDLLKTRLKDDGVFLVNVISALEGPRAPVYEAVTRTLSDVFEHVYVFANWPQDPTNTQNIFLVASRRTFEFPSILEGAGVAMSKEGREKAVRCYVGEAPRDRGVMLTDELNPVEYLVASTQLR